jgi:Protein of unknown function (DUF4232)
VRHATIAAGVIVIALGACSHSSHHASPTTVTSASTTTEPTTSTSTAIAPTTTSSTLPPATVPPTLPPATVPPVQNASCRSGNLTLTVGNEGGAAGTQYFDLQVRNHASFACHLIGYPGVSFLDGSGHQIGVPAARNPVRPVVTVNLAPGATVYSQVGVGNPDIIICTGVVPHEVRVYPPNETVPMLVAPPAGLRVCATKGTPSVGPVTAQPS